MKTIQCPKCGEVFTVDENSYADILKQVRDEEFKREVEERLGLAKESQDRALELAVEKARSEARREVAELREALQASRNALELAGQKAAAEKERLEQRLAGAEKEKALALKDAELSWQGKLSEKENERQALEAQIKQVRSDAALAVSTQKEQSALEKRMLLDEIANLKDYRKKLSTKMVGESLEQHCKNEFEKIRNTAFPKAYFEKDNEISDGTKGDFIFRDYLEVAEGGEKVELISIMFEMKNESDETQKKHKNEEFFKKLDEDRRKKNCEYAVLVSLLEPDSELYDQGIVDVSHRYDKMFVIRPQFFIPVLMFLKNAALKNAEAKRELALAKARDFDLTRFEEKLQGFKDKVGRDYRLAESKYTAAIEDIDKAIKNLTETKQRLLESADYLKKADAVAEDLTVRKLTFGNKTAQALIQEAEAETEKETGEEEPPAK